MKTHNIKILPYFILIFFLITVGKALSQNKKQNFSDRKAKIFVEYKLIKENLLNNDNIKVNVHNKKIILSGTTPTINDRNEAVNIAGKVNCNYKVVSKINIAPPALPDSIVVRQVLNKIRNNAFYNVFNWVTAEDSSGTVTLKGWVYLPWYKIQFQRAAEKIAGVTQIKNEIQNTFGPGELGRRVARLIYGDPTSMFSGLQFLSDPPVHIIVNNGNVILEGTVQSSAERFWAENQVLFGTNAVGVKNYIQVQS